MFWIIVVFAAVIAVWSFVRCGRLLQKLETIREAAEGALSDVEALLIVTEDTSAVEECQCYQDAMVFIALESNVKIKG